MKLRFILALVLPLMTTAAELLASKDENSTGADDEAAEAIRFAIERLQKYLA